jgi:hypothetical protein
MKRFYAVRITAQQKRLFPEFSTNKTGKPRTQTDNTLYLGMLQHHTNFYAKGMDLANQLISNLKKF